MSDDRGRMTEVRGQMTEDRFLNSAFDELGETKSECGNRKRVSARLGG
ncbi:hypothetical protein D1AOALGA4SA_8935 [Olavius algarvensis Delta 1 endosymbiont]|nr:hypothetical protein D1AOALGA4SA_8935 [Olavius algarvensis Delta 1 endosymbiont]